MYFYWLGERRARAFGRLFSVFSLSTFFPQKTAGFPHVAVIIHGIIHSSSTGHGTGRCRPQSTGLVSEFR
jgi:hypothetical protein